MSPVRSRESILARVWLNPPTSKRYIIQETLSLERRQMGVWDQREGHFIPDDEIERIDPDELLRI